MKSKISEIQYPLNEIKDATHFIHNFDVSVIMPFYKKMNEFRRVFPKNLPYFQRNGIEIVIAMDENSEEKALINFINQYPFINWKVIVNHNEHDWRNPVKAINVGIRNATKEYILVCSPESEFVTDVIYMMRKKLHYYKNHFTIGTVSFTDLRNKNYKNCYFIPYGSIMVKRKDIIEITGYDESLIKWGGDDDNVRIRLQMNGVKRLFLPEVKLIHRENKKELVNRADKRSFIPIEVLKKLLLPTKVHINANSWGFDFSEIVYSWEHKINNENILHEYLSTFKDYDLLIENTENKYDKILLVQSYNEEKDIELFLKNNAQHFDAIILLDDDSSDETYKMANHSKIILKVKKERFFFNDLENRNILLKLVSLFNCNWICFLDVDEIIDKRYANLSFTNSDNVHNVLFNLVHLWDSTEYYNAEYPFSNKGIQQHFRMFRNIGFTQIITHKSALHFKLAPYIKSIYSSQVLLLHSGNLTKEKRQKKYNIYKIEDKDKDQQSYEHIICNSPQVDKVRNITL